MEEGKIDKKGNYDETDSLAGADSSGNRRCVIARLSSRGDR